LIVYGGVERDGIVIEELVGTTQTGIMLQDVVIAQCIETPGCSIRTWVCREREVIQQLRDVFADVKACQESVLDGGEREVATLTR
jgi:hypothetical protein